MASMNIRKRLLPKRPGRENSQNKVTAWVPCHQGYQSNENAEKLAQEYSDKAMIGVEPFCGVAKVSIR